MLKKCLKLCLVSLSLVGVLTSCGEDTTSNPSTTISEVQTATYKDITANSAYGKLSDFSLENGNLHEGDVLTFKATPNEDYVIDRVTINGKECDKVEGKDGYYSCTLKAGVNKIAGMYKIDPTIDFVSKFKLNVSDEIFEKTMSSTGSSASDSFYDFRKDGIEVMDFGNKATSSSFINYVDGDTTHMTTLNYGYTVKIRYLGIDTPESTSEIEKWGKNASNFNKSIFQSAKYVILESQGVAKTGELTAATVDGNQRSLAYVWYATVDNPTKEDFRCLNLEMVYNGYSFGIGSIDDMGQDFYTAFDKANKRAQAEKLHIYADEDEEDPYYFDYTKNTIQELTLKKLYEDSSSGTDSKYANTENQTLYKIRGYVSRKLESAFYIQDKPSYERNADGSLPEAYGIYVFTYATTPIKQGDYVEIIGTVSTYGGSYQIQGISYHTLNADELRDTKIISSGHEIKPIQVSYSDFAGTSFSIDKLNSVLITFDKDLYCVEHTQGSYLQNSGGTQEIDQYNEKYPFYCTSNKIVGYADYDNGGTSSRIRFVSSEEVLFEYKNEVGTSYKFFSGGEVKYNPKGAEYVEKDTTKYQDETITLSFTKKIMKSATGISTLYTSSSGKTTQYSLTLTSKTDVTFEEYE